MSESRGRVESGDPAGAALPSLPADTDLLLHESGAHCRDYNFREYSPRVNARGRAHGATLLLHVARQTGLRAAVHAIVERLWRHLGRDQVVWGAKWFHHRFHSFEFYVYNREEVRPLRLRSVSSLQAALSPWLNGLRPPDEACSYTMCSLDVDARSARQAKAAGVHLYVAGGGEKRRQEAFSYRLRGDGLQLENHYTWYHAGSELDEVRQRLAWSAHACDQRARAALLPPELCECHTIAYATKRTTDALYFNRVTTQQLTWFARQHLPAYVRGFLEGSGGSFDHLFWDVGFDFLAAAGCPLAALRIRGVYGYV